MTSFNVTVDIEVYKRLTTMGIERYFVQDKADLSQIKDQPLKVDLIKTKSHQG